MTLTHRIKLISAKFRWFSQTVFDAAKYRKEIKEVSFIKKRRNELMMALLAEKRLVEDSDKIKELRAKISILSELL